MASWQERARFEQRVDRFDFDEEIDGEQDVFIDVLDAAEAFVETTLCLQFASKLVAD
jgi:hypothetical protein